VPPADRKARSAWYLPGSMVTRSRLSVVSVVPALLLAGSALVAPFACVLGASGTGPGVAPGVGGGGPGSGGGGPGSGGGEPGVGGGGNGVGGGGSVGGGEPGVGGAGGGEPLSVCGDGAVEGTEACDDGNPDAGDGCEDCAIVPGYTCDGQPSACGTIEPVVVTQEDLDQDIPDDQSYDGSIATMQCVTVAIPDEGFSKVQKVVLRTGIQHSYVGDLVIKVVSAQGTVTTVLSRPGVAEPADQADNGGGDSSNLVAVAPITFRDDAQTLAEDMGQGLNPNSSICYADSLCDFQPSPGNLAVFKDEAPAGDWQVCFADGSSAASGTIDLVELSVLAW